MRKRVILILAALVVVPLLAILFAALLIPRDVVARVAAERAAAAIGRPITIGGVDLAILPRPAVALTDVRVAGPTPDAEPLATVGHVLLRPRILPLFRGRVVVDELAIDAPRVTIDVDTAGVSNLPASPADSTTAPKQGSVAFDVRSLQVENGRIAFADARDGRAFVFAGYHQTLRLAGDVAAGRLRAVLATGRVDVDSLSARLPGDSGWTVRELPVSITHDARLLADSGRLELDTVRLAVREFALGGTGTVTGLDDRHGVRVVDVRLAAEDFDVADLLRSLPRAIASRLPADLPEFGGHASLDATVAGPVGIDTVPAVAGVLRLRGVSARRKGVELVRGLDGDVAFANDSAATDALTATLLGEPVRLSFVAHDPVDPRVRFAAEGGVSLDRVREAGLMPDSAPPARGRIGFDVSGSVRRSRPDSSRVEGIVTLEDLAVQPRDASLAVRVPDGQFQLGPTLRTRDLVAYVGSRPVTLTAAVERWLPAALGDTAAVPRAELTVRAPRIDVDSLMKPAEPPFYSQLLFARLSGGQIDGRDPAALAAERGTKPLRLPRLQATVHVRVDTLISGGVVYRDLDAEVVSSPERLEVRRARFGVMGGSADVAAVLTPIAAAGDTAPRGMRVSAQGKVTGVQAAPFLARFTTFRDHLSGTLDLSGSSELVLDDAMLPDRETLAGSGAMSVRDGQVVNWPAVKALAARLGVAGFDTLRLKELVGGVQITGPMVRLDDAVFSTERLQARLAGSFGFDGTLRLGAEARVPATLAASGGQALRQVAAAAADEEGMVPIGIDVTGTWRAPQVAPDLGRARENALAKAREAGKQEAQKLAERGAAALAERVGIGARDTTDSAGVAARLPSRDSVSAVVDSAKKALEGNVRDRLKKIF